ncbi:hypothetical protein ACSBPU_06840 [Parapusillimonas sp. JC17]|uniref:hypothetical protein n=1 Tax=Parapusillimonas sp. JC17 TaxID=3445768 RepID=UPI003FA0932D
MENARTTILMKPPNFRLTDWRVMEVPTGDGNPTRHVIGWTHSNVRVSSPIFQVDGVMRACLTGSGNLYLLTGDPAQQFDEGMAKLWLQCATANRISADRDVTDEFVVTFQQIDAELNLVEDVPPDFPHDYFLGAVPGSQLKFLAREIESRYIIGPAAGELKERYSLCVRLREQFRRLNLHREPATSPDDATAPSLAEIFAYVALEGWDLSAQERAWMVNTIESRT